MRTLCTIRIGMVAQLYWHAPREEVTNTRSAYGFKPKANLVDVVRSLKDWSRRVLWRVALLMPMTNGVPLLVNLGN